MTRLRISDFGMFDLIFSDRIYTIVWIYFLRHFPEESGETQSRLKAGKKQITNFIGKNLPLGFKFCCCY
jgi:hypothetical protein